MEERTKSVVEVVLRGLHTHLHDVAALCSVAQQACVRQHLCLHLHVHMQARWVVHVWGCSVVFD